MTFKNTKTILFASLIAAMILPFSGMMMAEAAPNENASDKAKDRYSYKVELLSKELISEEIVNGVKVTHFKQTVRQTDFPTMKEFREMNQAYFETLSGQEQGTLIAEFAQAMQDSPEVYEIETVKIGEHSISFETQTRSFPSGNSIFIKDPINLVFYDNGSRDTVRSILDNNAPHSWHSTSEQGPQWTFVDETAHGGNLIWAYGQGYEEGTYDNRYHARIFTGGNDSHTPGFGEWSLGAVHREYTVNNLHVHYSNTWETSENHIAGDFANTSGIGVISIINLGNSGDYQGYNNNGLAAFIQVE